MSIGLTIRTMLGLAVPDTADAFTAPPPALSADLLQQHHTALMDAAREALRAAHIERASAKAVLAEAEGRVSRALAVLSESQRLDTAAAEAEAVARSAAKAWAAAGCPEDARPDPGLLDKAAAASSAAIDGRTTAAGAQDALPSLRRAVTDAQVALGQAEGRVRDAAVGVLAAAAEPRLAELERLRDAFEAELRPLAALRHLLRRWGPGSAFSGFSNSDAGIALEKRIKELTPLPPADPDVNGAAADLRDRAVKLLDDAGATLDV